MLDYFLAEYSLDQLETLQILDDLSDGWMIDIWDDELTLYGFFKNKKVIDLPKKKRFLPDFSNF